MAFTLCLRWIRGSGIQASHAQKRSCLLPPGVLVAPPRWPHAASMAAATRRSCAAAWATARARCWRGTPTAYSRGPALSHAPDGH
eukprot:scaffold21839_cov65-Phaeocystis_antarctica.AAC.1